MPAQTVWQHIDVPLPELDYQNTTTAGQGKGSTEWAAHSHTPIGVDLWGDFDQLVTAEGQKPRNLSTLDIDFSQRLEIVTSDLNPISSEEDVTNRLESILAVFAREQWHLSGGIVFPQQNQQIIGKPDLIAQVRDRAALGVGPVADYESPPPRGRAQGRRENTELIVSLYRMPFETKPIWKFSFLTTAQYIIDNWEIPHDFGAAKMQAEVPLPESWSVGKKKVFHLVRQLYGQMVADKRRYGIIHLYERWFFCKRTPQGILKISRAFEKGATSPSVFQAIKTMVGFDDHGLEDVVLHPQSASKAPPKKKTRRGGDPKTPPLPPTHDGRRPGTRAAGRGGSGIGHAVAEGKNLAASLYPWECDVYDFTDSVLLLTTRKDPTVIVKLQSDPRMKHVADGMANEAAIYEALEGNEAAKEVIPCFRGHSTHLGVAMTCVEKELDDFDDIGLVNLSGKLKRSAIRAVEVLSEAGVLHNDIELRNIVKSKRDPSCAKIIDFGRASFSSDRKRLAKQVERIKTLLNTDNSMSGL
jgi:predicted Ser/Thr protein kinase